MFTHLRTLKALASASVAVSLCASLAAEARDIDPELRQYVIASCSSDAYRLCPQSLGSEREAVNCMKSKRAQLDKTCRVAYDKAVRVLAQ